MPATAPAVLPRDDFSVRWTGLLEAPLTEEFVFCTYNNDGVRLWIDGQLVIDDWKDWAGQRQHQYSRNSMFSKNCSRPIALTAGKKYAIRLEYYEAGSVRGNSEAQIHLVWTSPSRNPEHVPQRYLYPAR